jgi:DNA-binding PadR family transcriptional regulator
VSFWRKGNPRPASHVKGVDAPIVAIYTIDTVDEKPLKTTWFYILLALAGEDLHGLGIARDVLALSDGRVKLWPATLYGAIEELADRGWITELDEPRRPADESERKRYYRLTRAGRGVVTAETERMAGLVRVARGRVKPRSGASS